MSRREYGIPMDHRNVNVNQYLKEDVAKVISELVDVAIPGLFTRADGPQFDEEFQILVYYYIKYPHNSDYVGPEDTNIVQALDDEWELVEHIMNSPNTYHNDIIDSFYKGMDDVIGGY